MCGIAGIVTGHGGPPDERLLRRMSDAIAHRGPDASQVWLSDGVGLAHRRLAIIDLSEAGIQPMHDRSGRYAIVYNGEIYNYREVRAELASKGASFRTASDTEVILEAYRALGVDAFTRLRGMFALAIWDAQSKELVVARDKIGKKPLFISWTAAGDLLFASEIKALAPAVSMKPSLADVRTFLGLQYVPSPRTGFENVTQLLPGSCGLWKDGKWREQKYHTWIFPPATAPLRGESRRAAQSLGDGARADIDAAIRSKLDDAVKVRQMAADVPVGAFLSGGIDSAAVVAFASKHVERPLQTFTMGFPSLHMDERREAKAIADLFHTDHQDFEARPEHLQRLIDELSAHYDAPYADSSALPLWLLAQQTARRIKVVLTGDGGDELFGGYRRYVAYQRALGLPPIAAPLVRLGARLTGDVRYTRMAEAVATRAYGDMFCGSYFNSALLESIFASDFLHATTEADAVRYVATSMQGASDLASAMHFDLTSYLPDDLNVKMDRATMRFGLEARAPFLDQEMVQFALSLPLDQKVGHGTTKIALKRALKGIVPDDVLGRKKRGFQVPLAEWFRGPLYDLVRERCLSGPLLTVAKRDAVDRLIEENKRGADHGNRLWMLLTLSSWLTRHE